MTRQAITAPIPRPSLYGLVAAAPLIEDAQEWHQGFKFNPESCGTSGRVSVDCIGNTAAMDEPANPATVEGDPFAIYASDKCSTFGFLARDYEGRARRALELRRSYEIANEAWRGDLAVADGLDNLPFTDPTGDVITSTSGPLSPVDALAYLEQGLADVIPGRQGMIHITPQVLTRLVADVAVRLNGSTYLSPNGHIVVPDSGYDGSGPQSGGVPAPAGATQWAYATPIIYLRLGPVDIVRGPQEGFATVMDRAVNTVVIFAEQLVAYEWDECALLQAEINLPVPAIGGVS